MANDADKLSKTTIVPSKRITRVDDDLLYDATGAVLANEEVLADEDEELTPKENPDQE